jgi:hypothetical protein
MSDLPRHAGQNGLRAPLGGLIDALRRQGEALTTALRLSEAQTDAIARRDLASVNAISATLEREVVEGRVLEERRAGFAAELAVALGHDGSASIGELGGLLPPTEAAELRRAGEIVLGVVDRLATRSAANRTLLEHELAVIDQVVRIAHRSGDGPVYAPTGAYRRDTVSLLDARA